MIARSRPLASRRTTGRTSTSTPATTTHHHPPPPPTTHHPPPTTTTHRHPPPPQAERSADDFLKLWRSLYENLEGAEEKVAAYTVAAETAVDRLRTTWL